MGFRLPGQALGSPSSLSGVRVVHPEGAPREQKRSLESGREPGSPRESAPSLRGHFALRRSPGAWSPTSCWIRPASAAPAGKEGERVFLGPRVPKVPGSLAGRVPAVEANTPRRVSETILTSTPQPVLQSLNPSKMSPALPPLHSPPRRKNQERGGNWVGGPQARRVHAGACLPTSAPAPRPHPGEAPELALGPDSPFSKPGSASPRPLLPGQGFLNRLLGAPKTQTTLLGRPPCSADKETLPRSAGCATPQPSQVQTAGTHS